jgi:hypothetical protein
MFWKMFGCLGWIASCAFSGNLNDDISLSNTLTPEIFSSDAEQMDKDLTELPQKLPNAPRNQNLPVPTGDVLPPKALDEPLKNVDLIPFSEGGSAILREKLTCPDVLSGMTSMPPDADVNLVCQNCYTFCMMEVVILEYLKAKKKEGTLTGEANRQGQEKLLVIQNLLPGFLDACASAYWAFRTGVLREMLNQMQQKVQQETNSLSPQ